MKQVIVQKDTIPLSEAEIKSKLKTLPGWQYHDNKISKQFEFTSFPEAVKFIIRLSPFCQRIDHHPDIHIYYKKIQFDLQRFDIGGKVTERDFKVASYIEKLYKIS